VAIDMERNAINEILENNNFTWINLDVRNFLLLLSLLFTNFINKQSVFGFIYVVTYYCFDQIILH
jgi:hypothetical protein